MLVVFILTAWHSQEKKKKLKPGVGDNAPFFMVEPKKVNKYRLEKSYFAPNLNQVCFSKEELNKGNRDLSKLNNISYITYEHNHSKCIFEMLRESPILKTDSKSIWHEEYILQTKK